MSTYTDNEIVYPSVTTILGMLDKSGALMPWAAKLERQYCRSDKFQEDSPYAYKEVQEEALSIGSEVHNIIELYIKEGRDAVGELRDETQNAFLAFLDWEKENSIEWIQSEMTIISAEHCYAGTLDAVAKIGDKKYVIDFKTSKGFYSGYQKQISAYALAYTEMTGIPVDGCGILRIDKESGLPEWKDCTKNRERKESAFLKLLDFFYEDKKRRLKNNKRVK